MHSLCFSCGKHTTFNREVMVVCDENDEDFAAEVRVCGNCGDINSETSGEPDAYMDLIEGWG